MGPNRLASSVRPCFVEAKPDSGESCIVLQSGPTRSLIAKFPQHSVIACSTQISCCKRGMLRTRPRTGVCPPDVVALKGHQSYVSSADLPSDSLRKNLAWWAVTRRTLKNHKTVKSVCVCVCVCGGGVGACMSMGACSGQYGNY